MSFRSIVSRVAGNMLHQGHLCMCIRPGRGMIVVSANTLMQRCCTMTVGEVSVSVHQDRLPPGRSCDGILDTNAVQGVLRTI